MAETKKTTVKKTTAKAVKPAVKKVVKESPKMEKKEGTLTISVLDAQGKETGTIKLPEVVFGAKVNTTLIAQAVRVYLINQRQGTVSTLTRGEVDGSTRKIYRQKGTGRARHGGVRAPIFVKGGVGHGPKPVDYKASLSQNMRKAALFAALSSKVKNSEIKVVTGIEGMKKTNVFAKAFAAWGVNAKNRNVLFVLPAHNEELFKATRNLTGVCITPANMLNTYEVLKHKTIVFVKDAVDAVEKTFVNKK
ncbi:MAG TPA: 50S ribosomal protein L4 [Patescibacteria group bacterium]